MLAEVLDTVAERGAVYFAAGDHCEEWGAKVMEGRIALQRDYYLPTGRYSDGKEHRFRESKTIDVRGEGLALSIQLSWSREEYDVETDSWREVGAAEGVSLCGQAKPRLKRVERQVHYSIGGAELYLSRRSCEVDIARSAQGVLLATRC